MDINPIRTSYVPSGKLHPTRFVGSLAMLAAASAAIAVAYLILLLSGLHFPLVTLVMPVLGLAACATAAVKYGQIRQPLLAAVLAAAFGAAGYLATFHLDQCWRWNAPWTALDRLPGYIAFRMETDGWFFQRKFWVINPLPANPNFQPQVGLAQIQPLSLHWLTLVAETGIFIGVAGAAGWLAASAPFSELRKRWMQAETLFLHPDAQASFLEALGQRRIDEWVDAQPPRVPQQLPHWRLTVWYAPSEAGQEPDADVFVQLDRTYLRLYPAEAAALVTFLPGLLAMAGPAREQLAAEAERLGTDDSARIWPVPAPHAGQLQTARQWWLVQAWSTAIFLGLPAVVVILGIAGGVIVIWLSQVGILPNWAIPVYLVLGAIGFLAFLRYALVPGDDATDAYGLRFQTRLLRAAIAQRPESLISSADENAIYALAKPRRMWNEASGNRFGEANHGLLCIDQSKNAILFEGNYERYRIPAAAIVTCALETPPTQTVVVTDPWAVVVTARLGSGIWEFPFFPLANIKGQSNWERAAALLARIEQLCGREFAQEPAPPPNPTPVAVH